MLKIGAVMLIALALSGLALAAARERGVLACRQSEGARRGSKAGGRAGERHGALQGHVGRAIERERRLTWRLTFSHLTGSALASHIHLGKPGKAGPVAITLCGPCKNGQKGVSTATKPQFKAIESGSAYVNIHTKKNAAGEILGQIKTSS